MFRRQGLMCEGGEKHSMVHNNILKENVLKYRGLLGIIKFPFL